MTLNSHQYIDGRYFMDDSKECYEIRYKTRRQRNEKFRAFTTLEEAVKWAKRQREKIVPTCGCSSILRTLDGEDIFANTEPITSPVKYLQEV